MSKNKTATLAAIKARKKAYAPYSKFKVGASVVATNGKIYSGCNVENASYGGTICAERVAITKAVSEGAQAFTDVFVATDAKSPTPPCGLCRQVMAEFCGPKSVVHIIQKDKVVSTYTFEELLPEAFGPSHL